MSGSLRARSNDSQLPHPPISSDHDAFPSPSETQAGMADNHLGQGLELIEEENAASPRHDNQITPHAQQQYDPRALLNPRAPPKRPASEAGSDRGRENEPGQISLVERLHNVHQRTSSPAKRVKTDELKKPTANTSSGNNGVMNLNAMGERANTPTQASSIDLTMSKSQVSSRITRI